jgi:hypothetical protein
MRNHSREFQKIVTDIRLAINPIHINRGMSEEEKQKFVRGIIHQELDIYHSEGNVINDNGENLLGYFLGKYQTTSSLSDQMILISLIDCLLERFDNPDARSPLVKSFTDGRDKINYRTNIANIFRQAFRSDTQNKMLGLLSILDERTSERVFKIITSNHDIRRQSSVVNAPENALEDVVEFPAISFDIIALNNISALEFLISKGVDVNKRGSEPSPLCVAISSNNPKIVHMLLEAGANPNEDMHYEHDPSVPSSPLLHNFDCAKSKCTEIAAILLAYGAMPDLKGRPNLADRLKQAEDMLKSESEKIKDLPEEQKKLLRSEMFNFAIGKKDKNSVVHNLPPELVRVVGEKVREGGRRQEAGGIIKKMGG